MAETPLMNAIDIAASGLRAQRIRMNAISSNVANVDTTRTPEGGPYKRQIAVLSSQPGRAIFADYFAEAKTRLDTTHWDHLEPLKGRFEEEKLAGVNSGVELDRNPIKMVFDPTHPDADETGYVAMPNINIVTEMVNMISASRSYEANVTTINAVTGMARKALEI